MSTYAALGGVSASLQLLLSDRIRWPTLTQKPIVSVSTPRANREEQVGAAEPPGVNIFLYRVTENGYLSNQETPARRTPGETGRPPLSLDLHYLITGYGTNWDQDQANDTLAQITLGSAMRVLYDHAILTDKDVTVSVNPGTPILDTSVRGQFERVKICLESFNLEEISKIWMALTLPFRLSAAYQVSVAQIDSAVPRVFPRPVGELPGAGPRAFVLALEGPSIAGISVIRFDDPAKLERQLSYARIGDVIVVRGSNLRGTGTAVLVAGVDVTASAIQPLMPDRLAITLPDDPKLQPGAVAVRVVQNVGVGNPPTQRPWMQSNLGLFMLVPHIANVSPAVINAGATVTIDGNRLFTQGADCQAIIGHTVIQSDQYVAAAGNQIQIQIPAAQQAGQYAVRVRVAGAESFDAASVTVQ